MPPLAMLKVPNAIFGLGLQVTNVIKGIVDDLARGVSYVPTDVLRSAGTDLERLVGDPSDAAGRRVVAALVGRTLEWLDRAREYTLEIPAGDVDVRRFCALPLLLALRTLALAARSDRVFREEALKITREEVAEIDEEVRRGAGDDDALDALYARERKRVETEIGLATA